MPSPDWSNVSRAPPRERLGQEIELTHRQKEDRAAFREFADTEIAPHADRFDAEEQIPSKLVRQIAQRGYLGAVLPAADGGAEMDIVTFGLLNEELGRACSSVRSLLTVHSMVARTLSKWGSTEQKNRWLNQLASGAAIAAFALSEPRVGSDARSVETTATLSGDSYVLNGTKKWITFGQIADIYLVFAQCEGRPAVFLVPRDSAGLSVRPITGMLGVRASMLAELRMEECRIAKENLVGRMGFAVSHLMNSALDYGRYSVAWGCVGIAQACLEACVHYTNEREQFGKPLKEHPLIQQMMTRMITNVKAARLLCYQAGFLKEAGNPSSVIETSIAKYFASTKAVEIASDAVQIHGANGCSSDYPVQRYMRDAKIMEIIEGSTQIQEITIAQNAYQELML